MDVFLSLVNSLLNSHVYVFNYTQLPINYEPWMVIHRILGYGAMLVRSFPHGGSIGLYFVSASTSQLL